MRQQILMRCGAETCFYKLIFANKCVGGTRAGLEVFCSVLNLPSVVTQKPYAEHLEVILRKITIQANDSMKRARLEIRECYDVGEDEVADILIVMVLGILFTLWCGVHNWL